MHDKCKGIFIFLDQIMAIRMSVYMYVTLYCLKSFKKLVASAQQIMYKIQKD